MFNLRLLAQGFLALATLCFGSGSSLLGAEARTYQLEDVASVSSQLRQAAEAQVRAAASLKVEHDFKFTDRLPATGIRFRHQMTDDSGRNEKAIHYDHGSGVAVADVDGDGLLDVYFANQIGGNQLWRNRGDGTFEDITARAQVAVAGRVSVAVAFADLDNDGDADLIVTTVREGNVLFENLGNGEFRDVSDAAGWKTRFHSSGIVVADFNKDGLPDVFITSIGRYTTDQKGRGGYWVGMTNAFSGHLFPERSEPALLYWNAGGLKFKEAGVAAGVASAGWSGDAISCDINEDGWPDLYVLNMQGDDHLFVNIGGTRFEDQTARYFPKTPWGAMGVGLMDHDLDGRFDLLVTDMHSDMTAPQAKLRRGFNIGPEREKSTAWCAATWTDQFLQGASNNVFGNAFYKNLGAGKFVELSDRLGLETFWPWGVSVADVNGDGYEDVFVTAGMGHPFPYAINSLLLNTAGTGFRNAEFLLGIEPRRDGRVSKTSFTLDCDGPDQGNPLCQGKPGTVAVNASLSTRSSVFFDIDGDGDLDLVTNEFDDVPQVLVSDLAGRRPLHRLEVTLVGTASGRDALGAVVRVQAGGKSLSRYHHGKSGYLAQSRMPLYFGLGAAAAVSVEVVWPSGVRQTVTDGIPANGRLVIREPAAR